MSDQANSIQVEVRIKKLRPTAAVPKHGYGAADDAAVDLTFCGEEAVVMSPGARHMFPTGLALEIPVGFEGQVRPRSGLAKNKGVTVLNSPGTIDPGYRGEVNVLLINLSGEVQTIEPGERLAQLLIAPYATASFVVAETLAESERGAGGFGSSGTK